MKLNLRPYKTGDEKSVIQLWIDCGLVVSHNNPNRDIERKLKVDPEWFLVGELDGKIIATCMTGYDGHRGWINYLACSPSFQGRGFAKEILKRAQEILIDAGCPKLNVQIRTNNQRVIDFYKRLGFRFDDVVSMGKRLESDEPSNVESMNSAFLKDRPPD